MKNILNNAKLKILFRGFRGIVFALCSLLFALCPTSCKKDFLDAPEKSSLDESMIFSTPAYAKNAIAGILHVLGGTNSYRGRYIPWYGINTDVEVVRSMEDKLANQPAEKDRLCNYNTDVVNGQMNTENNAYGEMYSAIERANLAIRGLRIYADMKNWELRQILGEVLTLRAILYNDLLKGWGNVPARFEPIAPETIYVPRADRDVVLKQLLADLLEAEDYVGWPNENTYTVSTERINKAFVKALRAKIALIAGGYSMHVGETAMRMSEDPELAREAMYTIAKDECLDVINSGKARLEPGGFEECFRAVHRETYTAGNEGLWEMPFAVERGRVIFNLGVQHNTTDKYTGQNKGGDNVANPVMFYKFKKEDVRRNVSCVPYWYDNGKQYPAGHAATDTTYNFNVRFYYGKYRYEWMNRRVTHLNDDGLNFLYMRYADVLLMAAEAVNELGGDATPYISEIINRAYPNNPEIAAQEIAAASGNMFEAIVEQRAKEFLGEMRRKEDLIRWNLLTVKMEENRAELQKLDARESPYDNINTKVYHKFAGDNETALWWGLNAGELGTPPTAANTYTEYKWHLHSSSVETRPYWDRLYARDPSLQPYWPIWKVFIDLSNNSLVNDPIFN